MESQDYLSGQVMEKLASLEKSRTEQMHSIGGSINALDQKIDAFTRGIGDRVEKHGDRLTTLESSVAILNKVAWLLFVSSMTVVVAAFFKLVLK